jgi:hypothetical protein
LALIASSVIAALLILAVLSGWRLERRHRAGAVLDDAFEGARAPLVEVQPAGHRLEPHLEALHFDAGPRQLHDEVVDHFVVQRVELLAPGGPLRVTRVQIRLDVERLDERVGVEQELQERPEDRPQPADGSAVRLVERILAEREVGRRRLWLAHPSVFLQEARSHAFGIDELFELDVRQLADLVFGVVHAAFLPDPRADLPHDLLDVDVLGTD